MKRNEWALGTLLLCGGAMLLAPSLRAQNPPPDEVLTNAVKASSPSLAGPHHLEAQVTVFLADAKNQKGTYSLDWAAPDRFREEIHLPGYDEVKIASGTSLLDKRTAGYTPARVFQLEELMHPDEALEQFRRSVDRLAEEAKPGRASGANAPVAQLSVTPAEIGKDKSECVALGFAIPQVCVDAKHGWPIEITLDTPDLDQRIEYSDYSSLGNAQMPHERQFVENGVVVLEARVKKAFAVSQFDAAKFTPPDGAEQTAWCADMAPPVRQAIQAPASISEDNFLETEVLDGLVGADGALKRFTIIESGGANADAATQLLAGLIHFAPATCGGKPVEAETEFVVSDLDFLPPISEAAAPMAGKDGFGTPKCDFCPVPPYTDEAFKAGIDGSVELSVIIAQDGRAHFVRILKRLGDGLDEHAARFVRNSWRFTPANGPDGKPAAVRTAIEVTYKLRSSLSSELLRKDAPLFIESH
ncbi:MAG TPA: energy transducer TonB [Candidatus Acidoferrales bacterium]|nr:energy transducer TonB [Candidatus Acidoferrales bacterium]